VSSSALCRWLFRSSKNLKTPLHAHCATCGGGKHSGDAAGGRESKRAAQCPEHSGLLAEADAEAGRKARLARLWAAAAGPTDAFSAQHIASRFSRLPWQGQAQAQGGVRTQAGA
jgi:hypothetical protein